MSELAQPLEDDDLFGSTLPADHVPRIKPKMVMAYSESWGTVEEVPENWVSGIKQKSSEPKFKKDTQAYSRTFKRLAEMYPGIKCTKLESLGVRWAGGGDMTMGEGLYKRDFLGFADALGVTAKGAVVFIQITSKASIGQHMRKYVSDEVRDGKTIETHIRELLDRHAAIYIFGYHKPGRLWELECVQITAELLDTYKARKRK